LKRKKLSVRDLVHNLEQTVVDLLASYAIKSSAKKEAPGVYTNKGKICSIGLKVKRSCSYHGIAFNVAMDLTPFNFINPCGFKNLKMAQIKDFVPNITLDKIKEDIAPFFIKNFNYQ